MAFGPLAGVRALGARSSKCRISTALFLTALMFLTSTLGVANIGSHATVAETEASGIVSDFIQNADGDTALVSSWNSSAEIAFPQSSTSSQSSFDDGSSGEIRNLLSNGTYKAALLSHRRSAPRLEETDANLAWRTEFGVYEFSKITPHIMRLFSNSGTPLIAGAQFHLWASGDILPYDSRIACAADDCLEVVSTYCANGTDIAMMSVMFEFYDARPPKISAEIMWIQPWIADWCVVWRILPVLPYIVASANDAVSLSQLETSPQNVSAFKEFRMELGDSSEIASWKNRVVIDWSDAGHGVPRVVRVPVTSAGQQLAVEVPFEHNKTTVDPTVFGYSTLSSATGCTSQRKIFWYGGYYWAFYDSGYWGIEYQTSVDGRNWVDHGSGIGYVYSTYANGGPHGFALDQLNDRVALAWIKPPGDCIVFREGRIAGDGIIWSPETQVSTLVGEDHVPVAVSIGTDWKYWVVAQVNSNPGSNQVAVFCSEWGGAFYSAKTFTPFDSMSSNILLSLSDGNLVLIEAVRDGQTHDILWRYWLRSADQWTDWVGGHLGLGTAPPWTRLSAVARGSGTVGIVYEGADDARLMFAEIGPSTLSASVQVAVTNSVQGSPSIASDLNDRLHLFYINKTGDSYHVSSVHELSTGSWSDTENPFGLDGTEAIDHLTVAAHPIASNAVLWTRESCDVVCGLMVLPFSTAAISGDPWNRDGISPYGTYFQRHQSIVAPGSGQLYIQYGVVSIPGRGLDLGLSVFHMTPRFFVDSTLNPYAFSVYPHCNVGSAWQLNLPWMDDTYIHLGNGLRFLVQWQDDDTGNGNMSFENHDTQHFLLKKVAWQTKGYFLFLSSGQTYMFDYASKRLLWTCDANDYNPDQPWVAGVNSIRFNYDVQGNCLSSVIDSVGRTTYFSYNSVTGLLESVVRPDLTSLSFYYATNGLGKNLLVRVMENPAELSTIYWYWEQDDVKTELVSKVVFPTGSEQWYSYSYANVGTELGTFLVTRENVSGVASGATLFSYELLDGRVVYTSLEHFNESDVLVGRTKHIWQSSMKSCIEIKEDASGQELARDAYWYDRQGQVARVEHYWPNVSRPEGVLAEAANNPCTDCYAYDDWGNLVHSMEPVNTLSAWPEYQENAKYQSYENTNSEDSFKSAPYLYLYRQEYLGWVGKLFYESFDERAIQGWGMDTARGGVFLDWQSDPVNAPCARLLSYGSEDVVSAWHHFAPRTESMLASFRVCAADAQSLNQIQLLLGSEPQAVFAFRENGFMSCYYSGAWHDFRQYDAREWYTITFEMRMGTVVIGDYDVYVDNVLCFSQALLLGPPQSYIDSVLFSTNGSFYFDDVKVSKSPQITVRGLVPGEWVVVYDSNDNILQKARALSDGYAVVPLSGLNDYYPLLSLTPGTIQILSIDGVLEHEHPIKEIWGGDLYTYVPSIEIATPADGFYSNSVDWQIHNRAVGSCERRINNIGAGTCDMFVFELYSEDGLPIESKRSHNSGWISCSKSYDEYGNVVETTDWSGRKESFSYTYSSSYVGETHKLGNYEYFEFDTSWTYYEEGGLRWKSAVSGGYTGTVSLSSSKSVYLSFLNPSSSSDDGSASISRSYNGDFKSISISYLVKQYYHNGQLTEAMDSGVRLQLVDSLGVVYAQYSYWLACWSGSVDNRTPPANTKVICGKPQLGVWKTLVLNPDEDWSIDWSRAIYVRVQLYVSANDATGDALEIYFDDLARDSTRQMRYDGSTGRLTGTTDSLGGITDYYYDSLGRPTQVVFPDVGGKRSSIYYSYDDSANQVWCRDELWRNTVKTYDGLGRLVSVDRHGLGDTAYSSEYTCYDWRDKVKKFTNAVGSAYYTEYDFLGRIVREINPDMTYRSVDYGLDWDYASSGYWFTCQMVVVTDEKGNKTEHILRDFVTIQTTYFKVTNESIHEGTGSYNAFTDAIFDSHGNPTYVEGDMVLPYEMLYDDLNRVVTVYNPAYMHFETFTYDDQGRVTSKRDKNGQITYSNYDACGRLARVNWSYYSTLDYVMPGYVPSEYPSGFVHYMYDVKDRLKRIASPTATTTYSYDSRDRVTSLTEQIDGATYTLSFTYDEVGNLRSITYPDTVSIVYEYDDWNRITKVTRLSSVLSSYSYNADDSVDTATTGTGYETVYSYDSVARPKSIEVFPSSGAAIFSESYAYDGVGNVRGINSNSFGYDNLNRLVSWSHNNTSYTYSPGGDRLTKTENGITQQYGYSLYDQLCFDGTYYYNYDVAGNRLESSTVLEMYYTYQYDALGQLLKVTKFGSVVGEYGYDGNGARVKTVESGITRHFVYSGHDVYYEVSGTDAVDYVYANGHLVAKLTGSVKKPSSRTVYYLFHDAIGSTRLVITGTTIVFGAAYDPWGNIISRYGQSDEKLRFAGEIFDSSTGLYYIYSRYYDPTLGRFITRDSNKGDSINPLSMNQYIYCLDNPLSCIDPMGQRSFLKWWDEHWKEVAIVGLCVAVVITAGLAAPLLISGVGAMVGLNVAVSATVTTASALICAGVSAATTYALSGGKASFSEIMGSFVAGGVAGAFLPGIGAISRASTSGAMILGGISGMMGSVYGEVSRNIAGMAAEDEFTPSYNPMDTAFSVGIGAGSALIPGGTEITGKVTGIRMPGNYYWQMSFERFTTGAGSLRTIYNPLRPSGQYFYPSTSIDAFIGAVEDWYMP